MTLTQIVFYTLALFSVVVCDWCGGLFGIWLQLEVPPGVVFLNEALLPPSYSHLLPPPTHPPFISATSDITAMPVKAIPNQAGQLSAMSSLLEAKKMLYFRCKLHDSVTNYS